MYSRKNIDKKTFFTLISRAKKKDKLECYKMYSKKNIDKNFNKNNYLLKRYINKSNP